MMKTIIFCENSSLSETIHNYIRCYTEQDIFVFSQLEALQAYLAVQEAELFLISIERKEILPDILSTIRGKRRDSVIVLIGNNESEVIEAYRFQCDGFMLRAHLSEECDRVLPDMFLLTRRIKKLHIRTFGRFGANVGGNPIQFRSEKARELLALCVDRAGADVSMYEIVDNLWPHHTYDANVKCLYRKSVMNLKKTLETAGVGSVLCCARGYCHIEKDQVECDYFRFLENPQKYDFRFPCDYLFEFSWAEQTLIRMQESYPFDLD